MDGLDDLPAVPGEAVEELLDLAAGGDVREGRVEHLLERDVRLGSDDVEGRTKIYESMVKGTNTLEAGMPVVFDVLCHEIKGLGMNITLEKQQLEGGSLL